MKQSSVEIAKYEAVKIPRREKGEESVSLKNSRCSAVAVPRERSDAQNESSATALASLVRAGSSLRGRVASGASLAPY
eukprot:5356232-Pleurochrysis_carterae.AAC.1